MTWWICFCHLPTPLNTKQYPLKIDGCDGWKIPDAQCMVKKTYHVPYLNYPNVGEQTIHWASGDEIFFRVCCQSKSPRSSAVLFWAESWGKTVKRSDRPLDHEESIRNILKQRRKKWYIHIQGTKHVKSTSIPNHPCMVRYIYLHLVDFYCTIHRSYGCSCMNSIWTLYDYLSTLTLQVQAVRRSWMESVGFCREFPRSW